MKTKNCFVHKAWHSLPASILSNLVLIVFKLFQITGKEAKKKSNRSEATASAVVPTIKIWT